MTSRGSDRGLALVLGWGVTVSLGALSLAMLRRPFHDTAGELLLWRVWVSDLLHAGDWPFWLRYARYGFQLTTLQLAPAVWSPVGLLLGALFQFDVWTMSVEVLLWRVVGLAGAFLFARPYVHSAVGAMAVAACYVCSGHFAGAVGSGSIGGSMIGSFIMLPWLGAGVAWGARARRWRDTAGAAGALALATSMLVMNGYPGTWLTAPLLLVPFAVCLGTTSVHCARRLGVTVLIAALLTTGLLSLFISETYSARIFGSSVRESIDPAQGLFAISNLYGLWLANSVYLPVFGDSNNQLVYVGLLPVLLLSASWPLQAGRVYRSVRVPVLTACGVVFCVALLASGSATAPRFVLPLAVMVSAAFSSPTLVRRWQRIDWAMGASALLALLAATPNPFGDFLRSWVPPFSLVRWNAGYLWVLALALPLLSWRTLEHVVRRAARSAIEPRRLPAVMWMPGAATLALVACASLVAYSYPGWLPLYVGPEVIEVVDGAWALYLLGSAMAACGVWWWVRGRRHPAAWLGAWASTALLVALAAGAALHDDEALVHAVWRLFPGGRHWIDMAHQLVVAALLWLAWRHSRNRAGFLRAAAVVTVFDVSLASTRYLSSVDARAGSQSPAQVTSVRSFDRPLSGRRSADTNTYYPRMVPLLHKEPTLAIWPGYLPQFVAYDAQLGEPSVFSALTVLPYSWKVSVDGKNAEVGAEQLRALTHGTSTGVPAIAPSGWASCGVDQPNRQPAIVTRLLASEVWIDAAAGCNQLVVYMDTWAPGSSALVDGQPAAPLRVDELLRGVVIPPGRHRILWRYRPPYAAVLLPLMGVSLVAALLLFAAPWWVPVSRRGDGRVQSKR